MGIFLLPDWQPVSLSRLTATPTKSKPKCTVPGLSPPSPVPLWPHDRRCTCDLPAMPCWPSNPLSSPWLLPPQCAPFRPLLCPGTLTLPPNSLVPELPQLEWLDLVLESVASSIPHHRLRSQPILKTTAFLLCHSWFCPV